ncbi:PHP domain-containing protein [Nostocoides sp. Soil756]|uniref:DNA polymerase III subunit alpha n=1 Tax=Nostocoides sp. Soil756 TaxID=1736399 RepID=UPI0006F7CBDF|nr:PHP domain-containing protein [Tetrasphaera sp. Soil756]KRE63210.1 DNA polymerase III subunit alpha [Tetrasphaera sp. Soil756]
MSTTAATTGRPAAPGPAPGVDGFAHLHVASGFSMRYGASTPEDLVARAAELGQGALALTDRDGLYGAVRFARACGVAGLDPVLGVDLAVADLVPGRAPRRVRTPVRGGAVVDPRRPRVTVLARGRGGGAAPGGGWAALCRLVTATHLRGERGVPVTTPDLLARWSHPAADPGRADPARPEATPGGPARLVVLLGPDSDVGRAVLAGQREQARTLLARWRTLLPRDGLAVEVVLHGGPEGTPGCRSHAARLLGLADAAGVPAVLSAAVRHAEPGQVRAVDVLDAARRLVVLDSRHLDRVTDAAHLADTGSMRARALEVTAGDTARADRLLTMTALLTGECVQHARDDLGIGAVHLPEPEILGIPAGTDPMGVLARRCRAAVERRYPGATDTEREVVLDRLDTELTVIRSLGYPTYFLTVAEVTDLVRARGVRVAARGSGAGSLVNHLLGISGVDPIRHRLLMERFCSPLRAELPDIDVDVESARRTEIYEAVLERFGGERVTCVSMMDTYKVRHAVRDVGAALGMPPVEVDEIAKAFPHIRARDARHAIADLPELRSRGLDSPRLAQFFDLVEALDGLPRHIALHPCGVVLSNAGMLDRTPVEASWLGFPMSQFDKDDVETLGFLKLDVLGIRMQSSMAHAVAEVERVSGQRIDLDDEAQVPLDDPDTFELIRTTRTLGMFQIESPGQRELVGKLGPRAFDDLIVDISLFRPGPVKSDMITPFLESRHGWRERRFLHPSLVPALEETEGVVVFHEQVLLIVAETTGVSLAQADEVRRSMGTPHGQEEVEAWWRPAAQARGYDAADRDRIWEVLKSFASFGFCKAHAAAFALPTYHSAWLKTHHPAAFLAGILTHDPGMYPKRLLLDDARSFGIPVLGLDVNASREVYRVEPVEDGDDGPAEGDEGADERRRHADVPPDPSACHLLSTGEGGDVPGWRRDPQPYGIRLSLADVKGISEAEVARIVAGQPYADLGDFWARARVSRPVTERLVLAGAFDALHGMGSSSLGHRGRVTRRDLLLHVAELERWERGAGGRRGRPTRSARPPRPGTVDGHRLEIPASAAREVQEAGLDVRLRAAAQSQAAREVVPAAEQPTQLTLDLGDRPRLVAGTGLPEMTGPERVRAELDVLGLDVSAHVIAFYEPLLAALGVTRSRDLVGSRSRREVWVSGVKVATQTPPVRSGRRVVFLTLDDGTGPSDCTFFEDVQGPYAGVVFHSWMLLVRGVLRRTGDRGVSIRATGAWELAALWDAWQLGGLTAVRAAIGAGEADAVARAEAAEHAAREADARTGRRVLVHASGFRQSPYADIKPAGADPRAGRGAPVLDHPGGMPRPVPGTPPGQVVPVAASTPALPSRKLWHASPGSSGH